MNIVAVPLAAVAGAADREEAEAPAAPLEAESVVVHVVTDDDENLPRPPASRIVRRPSSTAEGSGVVTGALDFFSASSGPPIYGEMIAGSTFLPTGPTVRSRRLQAAVNNACARQKGAVAALLRREGLYSSHLASWRAQRATGQLGPSPRKRGPVPTPPDARDQQIADLERRALRAEARADRAERLVELQKKVSLLLEIPLPEPESEPRR